MAAALFDIPDPRERATQQLQGAINTYSQQMPNIKTPGKTIGGGIMNAMGGAMAGGTIATMASEASMAGPIGLGVGAILGTGAYFLS